MPKPICARLRAEMSGVRRVENLRVGVRGGVIIGQLQVAVADFAPRQHAGFVGRIQLANLAEHIHGQLKIRQRIVGVRRILLHQRAAVGEQGLRVQVRRTIRVTRQGGEMVDGVLVAGQAHRRAPGHQARLINQW